MRMRGHPVVPQDYEELTNFQAASKLNVSRWVGNINDLRNQEAYMLMFCMILQPTLALSCHQRSQCFLIT